MGQSTAIDWAGPGHLVTWRAGSIQRNARIFSLLLSTPSLASSPSTPTAAAPALRRRAAALRLLPSQLVLGQKGDAKGTKQRATGGGSDGDALSTPAATEALSPAAAVFSPVACHWLPGRSLHSMEFAWPR
uniref:Uncharacterized protein n=1 Tax=Leersia perrieri TaxID=77586 RepID=A0A0D9VBE0_9ORYZ